MKKAIIISALFIGLLVSFSACTKYEEGPSFSVLTPEMRIKGQWNQTALYINDVLSTSEYTVEFTFNSGGTGTLSTSLTAVLGTSTDSIDWQFADDKTILQYKEIDATEWDDIKILRLTNSEMWIQKEFPLLGICEFRYEKV
jgi:hypothetical protein